MNAFLLTNKFASGALTVLGFVLFFGAWWVASLFTYPLLLPSPLATLETAIDLSNSGVLWTSIAISMLRILAGWLSGAIVGIPLGLLMGRIALVRDFATPYVQGLRYIPPLAFIGLFIVWFGPGEGSKIMLVFYTSIFIVILNLIAGAKAVPEGLIRAARSLGASEFQVLVNIVVPATVPYMITGMRIGLGNAFISIAAAEMLSAQSGMGFLIWSARSLMLTDQVFVGFLVLGLLGLISDRLFRFFAQRFLPRYRIV
jgi:ABC-type nitrate/sulfonate/bicarbonate transport system permease component